MSRSSWALVCALVLAVPFSTLSYAVTPDRIAGAVDSSNVVELRGHVSPWAQSQFDQGPVAPSRAMRVTMLFAPSGEQQQALDKLLAQQQDSTSPNFHKWLTSDQFGQQFGLSQGDLDKISAWLRSQGLKITYVAHGREFLSFEGNARQVQSVFRTELHNYNVNGKMHFANVTPPQIPAALSGIIGGFRGLHDFFPRPHIRPRPAFTVSGQNTHFLSPGDIATIYDMNPLYKATVPIDGTGQTVVIAGQSDVYLADLNFFRSAFGLSSINGCTTNSSGVITACNTSNFQMVIPSTGSDPGLSTGNLAESDLDIETMSGVARGAQIIFVTSSNGVDDSASWAIDQNPPLAPVISYSYGLCEAFVTAPSIAAAETVYKQASAEGISFFASSGDAAAATCDGDNGTYPAQLGLSVSYPASSPEVTGVGGTEFNEGNNSSVYWGTSNGTDGASVLPNGPQNGYIPELAWNDSALAVNLDGTGGGPSNCAFGSGTTTVSSFLFELCNAPPNGGFPKPTWQGGSITPADGVRDVPDISFSASNANDLYIVCAPQSEIVQGSTSSTSTCAVSVTDAINTYGSVLGGTSGSAPVAAGMTVLLNQFLGANGLGNINPQLYTLYGTNPTVFHDIGTGTSSTGTGGTSDNLVPCSGTTPSFEPSALRCPAPLNSQGTFGYSVAGGHHYNLVTGLGSVDVNALFNAWSGPRNPSTVSISASAPQINVGQNITFKATVSPTSGTGTVSFSTVNNSNTTVLGTAVVNLPYPPTTMGTATFSTTNLPGGSNSVTATYLGDASTTQSVSIATVVNVIAPDFTLASNPTTATVVAGHNSSAITVTITPVNGYSQATTLSCVTPPTGASCNFAPNPMPAGTTTSTLTIATNASMATGAAPQFNISATNGGSVTHTSPFTLTVNTTDQSYTLTPGATSYQVTPGGTVNGASATVTLTGTNGFSITNSPVSYTCSEPATLTESTCNITPNATGATFVITTTAPSLARVQPAGRSTRIFYAAMMPGLLGIMFIAGSRKRSQHAVRVLGLIFMLGVSTIWMASCSGSNGGSKNPGTPAGTYTITVNATTNGTNPLTAQTTLTLQVQ